MVAATRIRMANVNGQKRYETELGRELTPDHTVEHALEHYRERMGINGTDGRWAAVSRGIRLDAKTTLGELTEDDTEWTVMPEVSAG